MKLYFVYIGGLIAFLNLVWFAYKAATRQVPPQNPASWFMWTVIDGLLFITMFKAGIEPWLALAYTLGALSVMIAMHIRGKWEIGAKEILGAICAAITTYVWLEKGAGAGAITGVAAMTAAGMPIWVDMYKNPVRASAPMWGITVLACIFTLLGSPWTFEDTLLSWGGIAFNGSIFLIVRFKKSRYGYQQKPTDRDLKRAIATFRGEG